MDLILEEEFILSFIQRPKHVQKYENSVNSGERVKTIILSFFSQISDHLEILLTT